MLLSLRHSASSLIVFRDNEIPKNKHREKKPQEQYNNIEINFSGSSAVVRLVRRTSSTSHSFLSAQHKIQMAQGRVAAVN